MIKDETLFYPDPHTPTVLLPKYYNTHPNHSCSKLYLNLLRYQNIMEYRYDFIMANLTFSIFLISSSASSFCDVMIYDTHRFASTIADTFRILELT